MPFQPRGGSGGGAQPGAVADASAQDLDYLHIGEDEKDANQQQQQPAADAFTDI